MLNAKNVFFHSTALLDEMKAAALRMFFSVVSGRVHM